MERFWSSLPMLIVRFICNHNRMQTGRNGGMTLRQDRASDVQPTNLSRAFQAFTTSTVLKPRFRLSSELSNSSPTRVSARHAG